MSEETKESTQLTDELLLTSKLFIVKSRQMFLPGLIIHSIEDHTL